VNLIVEKLLAPKENSVQHLLKVEDTNNDELFEIEVPKTFWEKVKEGDEIKNISTCKSINYERICS
jgi:hypothetical protein